MPPPGGTAGAGRRDRGERAVRGVGYPALRLGAGLRRGELRRAAPHVLRPHRHGAVAAGPALRGDPAPPGPAPRPFGAPALGRGPARRTPSWMTRRPG